MLFPRDHRGSHDTKGIQTLTLCFKNNETDILNKRHPGTRQIFGYRFKILPSKTKMSVFSVYHTTIFVQKITIIFVLYIIIVILYIIVLVFTRNERILAHCRINQVPATLIQDTFFTFFRHENNMEHISTQKWHEMKFYLIMRMQYS